MLSKNGNENVPSSVLKAKLLSFATLVNGNFQNEFAYVLNYLALGYANINSDIHGTRIPRTPLQSNISNASQTLTNTSGRILKLQDRRILPFVNDLAMPGQFQFIFKYKNKSWFVKTVSQTNL